MTDENIKSESSTASPSSITADVSVPKKNIGEGRATPTKAESTASERSVGRRQTSVTILLTTALVLAIGGGVGASLYFARQAHIAKSENAPREFEIEQELAKGKVAQYALQLREVEDLRRHNSLRQAHIILKECPEELRGWEHAQLRHLCRTPTFFLPGKAADILLFNPEGDRILTVQAEDDAKTKLIVWDAETAKKIVSWTVLTTIGNRTARLAYGPNDRLAVVVEEDNPVVELYSTKTGKNLKTLKHPSWSISCVEFSPEGRFVVAGSKQGVIGWSAANGKTVFTENLPSSQETRCIGVSPDFQRIALAHPSEVTIWDIKEEMSDTPVIKYGRSLKIENLEVRALAFAGKPSHWLGIGGRATPERARKPKVLGEVQVWNLNNGMRVMKAPRHNAVVQSLRFDLRTNPFGVITVGEDGFVFRAPVGANEYYLLPRPFPRLSGAGLQMDRGLIAWQDAPPQKNGQLVQVRPIGPRLPITVRLDGPLSSVACQHRGTRIVHATNGRLAKRKGITNDIESIRQSRTDSDFLRQTDNPTTHLCFDASDAHLTATTATNLYIWDWDNEEKKIKVALAGNTTHAMCAIPKSSRIAVARSKDGKGSFVIQAVDVKAGQVIATIRPKGPILSMSASPEGKFLAVRSPDHVQIWKTSDLAGNPKWAQTVKGLLAVSFPPDEKQLLSLAAEFGPKTFTTKGTVTTWSLNDDSSEPTSVREVPFGGVFEPVAKAVFSPSVKRFVTAAGDTMRIWDTKTGQRVMTYRNLPGDISRLAFSSNGQYLLCGAGTTEFGTVVIWEAEK